jgi:hypothetical protein
MESVTALILELQRMEHKNTTKTNADFDLILIKQAI